MKEPKRYAKDCFNSPSDILWPHVVDTETSLKDCVQTDSAVAYLQSEVIAHAARDLKIRLLEKAAKVMKQKIEDLDILEGNVFLKNSKRASMTVKELMNSGDLIPIVIRLGRAPNSEKTGVPYIATFAEVEVDTETGKVEVLKLVVLNDWNRYVCLRSRGAANWWPVHGIRRGINRRDHIR